MAFLLRSTAFFPNDPIPLRYSREGENLSPPLEWADAPTGTKSFALICEDPDAPQEEPFVHWLIYDIAANVTNLGEGRGSTDREETALSSKQGVNSYGTQGYGGPLPPVGHGRHRYIFTLYALNKELHLGPGATKKQLLRAMEGSVIEHTQLTGTYVRPSDKAA